MLARRRDDGGGIEFFSVRSRPGFPQPGKSHRRIRIFLMHEIGSPGNSVAPVVKSIRRNEAAAAPHRVAESRLLQRQFAARVDEKRKFLRILHPGRNKSPARQRELALAIDEPHDRNWLSWRDVIAGRKIRQFVVAEEGPDGTGRRSDDITCAHWDKRKPRSGHRPRCPPIIAKWIKL